MPNFIVLTGGLYTGEDCDFNQILWNKPIVQTKKALPPCRGRLVKPLAEDGKDCEARMNKEEL